jgi:hypothetical protein
MAIQIPDSDRVAMARAYPTWYTHSHGRYGGWEGTLRPLPPNADVRGVLGAIWHEDELTVLPGGILVPVNPDSSRNLPGWLHRIRELPGTYRIRVHYEAPPFAPSAMCLEPLISWSRFPHHPHLYYSFNPPETPAVLCPFLPSDGNWVYGTNDIAEFVHMVVVWIVCHQVYEITGRWPGPGARHDPVWLLEHVDPRAVPCVCGRQVPYGECCRPRHLMQLRRGPCVR